MSRNQIGLSILALVLLISAVIFLPRFTAQTQDKQEPTTIFVASIVEIEPIAQLRNGFRTAIVNSDIGQNVEFIERNAQGDAGLIAQIANEVAREQPDLVYVLGTPLAQAIQKRAPNVVLVQGAVTDPVAAGLADSWGGSGRKYAANSDRPPAGRLLNVATALVPTIRDIAVLYSASETNSIAVLEDLKVAAVEKGLSIREVPVTGATDLPVAINVALSQSDALIIPPDNMVTSGLTVIIEQAKIAGKPVFATTQEAVAEGALAGVTTDFEVLGAEAGGLAISILVFGADPSTMPIATPEEVTISVNRTVADALNVEVPSSLDVELVGP